MFASLLRSAIRSALIQNGPMTCSNLVHHLGMDPRRHKGTIHALMVDLETAGILSATRSANGKRDEWFIIPTAIRKRDRLVAAMLPV
jgi:hypothetical protein